MSLSSQVPLRKLRGEVSQKISNAFEGRAVDTRAWLYGNRFRLRDGLMSRYESHDAAASSPASIVRDDENGSIFSIESASTFCTATREAVVKLHPTLSVERIIIGKGEGHSRE